VKYSCRGDPLQLCSRFAHCGRVDRSTIGLDGVVRDELGLIRFATRTRPDHGRPDLTVRSPNIAIFGQPGGSLTILGTAAASTCAAGSAHRHVRHSSGRATRGDPCSRGSAACCGSPEASASSTAEPAGRSSDPRSAREWRNA
jgi:hypothetical protein